MRRIEMRWMMRGGSILTQIVNTHRVAEKGDLDMQSLRCITSRRMEMIAKNTKRVAKFSCRVAKYNQILLQGKEIMHARATTAPYKPLQREVIPEKIKLLCKKSGRFFFTGKFLRSP